MILIRMKLKSILTTLFFLLSILPMRGQEFSECPYKFSGADKANLQKGIEAYEAKKYSEANTLLRKVSSKNPKAADPYLYLGLIAAKQNQNPAAIRRYFSKLIELCPNHPNALAHFYMGVILYTDEKYDAAVKEFNSYFDIANRQNVPEFLAVYQEASNYLYWSQFLAEAQLNPVPFSPTVVYGASSRTDEILPFITWDGKEIYYLRQVSRDESKSFYDKVEKKLEPMLCHSFWRDTAFSSGRPLDDPFNQGNTEGGVSMTADNRTLYYSVLTNNKGTSNFDIFFSQFRNGQWGPIENAGINVNSAKAWDSQPSISADGQYLYFASNREGGMGGTDIWRCHRLPNGDWSRPENLGPSVNTSGNEKCPFLHADGHTLYFSSNGWQGFGGYDMYFINLSDLSSQRPSNMGMPINGEGDDFGFGVTCDGKRGYYAAKSKDYTGVGGTDIWWFDLYPGARPEPMRVIPVRVQKIQCAHPVSTQLVLSRFGLEDAVYYPLSDTTSVALSLKETNVVAAMAEGYMPVVKVLGKQESQFGDNLEFVLFPIEKDRPYSLGAKLFDRNSRLTDQGRRVLDVYVEYLQQHPRIHVRIEAQNEQESRAVYDYFLSKKLRVERLQFRGTSATQQPRLVVTQAQ